MFFISKFAQKIERDGYICRFNSLKNIPVFYKKEIDSRLEDYIVNEGGLVDDEIFALVSELEKAKVIVPSQDYDDNILRAIRNCVKKPYPAILYIMLTEKCNFACDYCFIERHMDQSKTNVMTKEIALKALDFYVHQIAKVPELFEEEKNILFYGGEPLSNYDVLKFTAQKIQEYIKVGKLPKKTNVSMVTNGAFITEEIAKELKELNVSFSISLDGATPQANVCRKYHSGKPAYDDIIKGLENAKAAGCECGLSVTLSQEALKEGNLLFDLIDKYQIKSMGFNILLTDSVYSVPEQYFIDVSQFIVDAFKIFRDKGIYEDRIMRKVNAFVEHKLHFQDCAAEGGNQLVVAPDGEVGLCHGYLSTRETFVTNVNDFDFDMTTDTIFLDWNKRTPFNMLQCENCMALGTCGGGCALNAKANGKSIWDLDERFCIHAKATIEFLIWDLFDQIKKEAMN